MKSLRMLEPIERQHMTSTRTETLRPKAFVVTTIHWPSTTRFCLALAESGFDVIVQAPPHHALHALREFHTLASGRTRSQALLNLIETTANRLPDIIIPADEGAIDLLQAAYACASRSNSKAMRNLVDLIKSSVGGMSALLVARQKNRFIRLAEGEGLLVPPTEHIASLDQLCRRLSRVSFPVVLKLDDGYGGLGVRIAMDVADACAKFTELKANSSRWSAVKETCRRLDPWFLRRRGGDGVTLQKYIDGRPANRAVACHRGVVLAGLSVEALETVNETGPATVVRVIDSDTMKDAAERMVRRLHLSGFVGFDFVLDGATNSAFLLEMNLRPTQICHLATSPATDLTSALARVIAHGAPGRRLPNYQGPVVALFPQEAWRDASSPYLASAFHDLPANYPEILRLYREPVPPEPLDWVRRMRRNLASTSQTKVPPGQSVPAALRAGAEPV